MPRTPPSRKRKQRQKKWRRHDKQRRTLADGTSKRMLDLWKRRALLKKLGMLDLWKRLAVLKKQGPEVYYKDKENSLQEVEAAHPNAERAERHSGKLLIQIEEDTPIWVTAGHVRAVEAPSDSGASGAEMPASSSVVCTHTDMCRVSGLGSPGN